MLPLDCIVSRFLHPGVTDKGNYTMFDMVRPVPMSGFSAAPHFHDFRDTRPPVYGLPLHHTFGASQHRPPAATPTTTDGGNESAWERGLRTAKEMMRKASKRKEQDIDFEDKKMNLSLSQEELEKDNYYIRDRGPNEVNASAFNVINKTMKNHSGPPKAKKKKKKN